MSLFGKLFGGSAPSAKDNKLLETLAPGKIGYLTASCCDPGASLVDESLERNVREALNRLGVQANIEKETLTGAQSSIRTIADSLNEKQSELVGKVLNLFSTSGMGAFPMIFINGELAFYGGVPPVDDIAEYIKTHPLTPAPAAAAS